MNSSSNQNIFNKQDPSLVHNLTNRTIYLSLAISGLIGFCLAALIYPTWQEAVEYAQIVGAVIHPTPHSNYALIEANIWSILVQFCAILLRLGLSEVLVSIFVSGLLGMVSFQAISLCALACTENIWMSLITPVFIYATRAADFGAVYPIWLLGYPHTHGIIGLSCLLLSIAFLSLRKNAWGAFLLGILPSIHSSYGVLGWIIISGYCLTKLREIGFPQKTIYRWFIIGTALATASYLVQQQVSAAAIVPNAASGTEYILAFIKNWDAHRRAVPLLTVGTTYLVANLLATIYLLKSCKASQTVPINNLLWLSFIASACGIIGIALSWLPPEILPISILILMPMRWMNLSILLLPILCVGLLARSSASIASRLWLLLTLCMLYFLAPNLTVPATIASLGAGIIFLVIESNPNSIPTKVLARNTALSLLLFGTVILIGKKFTLALSSYYSIGRLRTASILYLLSVATILSFYWKTGSRITTKVWKLTVNLFRKWPQADYIAMFCLTAIALTINIAGGWKDQNLSKIHPWVLDAALAATQIPTLLVTSSDLHYVQLRTRQAVLIDGGRLDVFPYRASVAKNLNQILLTVYDTDILNPSTEVQNARSGGLLPDAGKIAWEDRTAKQWQQLALEFRFTGVITYPDWKIQLPLLSKTREYALYGIP